MTATIRPIDPASLLRMISVAIGLACGSALAFALLFAAMVNMAAGGVGLSLWLAAVVAAHGGFIAMIADLGFRARIAPGGERSPFRRSLVVAAKGAVPVAVPLAAAIGLVAMTGDLRWSLLGWGALVATAIPALVLIEVPGWPIQICAGECWGLMKGGVVAGPLLGAYLFLASFSAALLSVFAVRSVKAD